ncbi:uncharacterized protein V1510DRAFT_422259 [Dipodascopsis tothii]|uniref:uncharacterized protein n=1 Tax=Dipodascopsis tothii TaxID=44089 RepID=UPI0034CFCC00
MDVQTQSRSRPRLAAAFRSYSGSRLRSGTSSSSVLSSSTPSSPSATSENLRPRSHTVESVAGPSTFPVTRIGPRESSLGPPPDSVSALRLAPPGDCNASDEELPSLRMTPFIDHSSTTPALYFEPIERRGRAGNIIRLGRYTDKREASKLAAATGDEVYFSPVVFKSKVVSRAHAELWVENKQWYVKDIMSSSGTFLNHVRLSPPSQTSQPYPIKDGDILQLGMDFRGGAEEVYKCVKMRLEVNRSWQKRINMFNASAHTRLRTLTTTGQQNGQSQECSICLVAVAPCQALFVAPCSHVWHYKCIRPIVIKAYPQFLCPNCRAVCDLEADVDVGDIADVILDSDSDLAKSPAGEPMDISEPSMNPSTTDTVDPPSILTPPNHAGPYVFDGMVVDAAINSAMTTDSPITPHAPSAPETAGETQPRKSAVYDDDGSSTSSSSAAAEGLATSPTTPAENAAAFISV